jgi:hypothetical protein
VHTPQFAVSPWASLRLLYLHGCPSVCWVSLCLLYPPWVPSVCRVPRQCLSAVTLTSGLTEVEPTLGSVTPVCRQCLLQHQPLSPHPMEFCFPLQEFS